MGQTVFFSNGMGVESATVGLRWFLEPETRDFALEDLVVGTAMTGDEHTSTGTAFSQVFLPLFRKFGVRYVQVARRGPLREDGIVVLDDSRAPSRLYIEGAYRLSQELLRAGTVPQFAKHNRRCSNKSKGWVLDSWIREHVRGPFRHVMGYNSEDLERVEKDMTFRSALRLSEYPLVAWGWNRERCEEYLFQHTGIRWPKSCCTFCPFTRGQDAALSRLLSEPGAAEGALLVEHVALALNERITLYSKGSLRELLEERAPERVRAFLASLSAHPWAVYRVRRAYKALGVADRDLSTVFRGTREQAEGRLLELAPGAAVRQGSLRWQVRESERGVYPSAEELLVACPAIPEDKRGPRFAASWRAATGEVLQTPQLSLFAA